MLVNMCACTVTTHLMDSKSMATVFVRYVCDQAYEDRPYECKFHQVISSLISFVPNALSHFRKLQKKAHYSLQ